MTKTVNQCEDDDEDDKDGEDKDDIHDEDEDLDGMTKRMNQRRCQEKKYLNLN